MKSTAKGLWIKRCAGAAAMGIVLLAASLYTWIPGVVMGALNYPRVRPPYAVQEPAQSLHTALFVADMQCGTLFWPVNLLTMNDRGLVDVPRLIEGNIALQCFFARTCLPLPFGGGNRPKPDMLGPIAFFLGWPSATWLSPRERALHLAGQLDKFAARAGGRLTVIHMREDLERYLARRKVEPGITAGLLGTAGMQCLEEELENVRVLYHAGYRILAPVDSTDSPAGGSSQGRSGRGLTDFGAKVIRYMEQHRMLVDLTQASNALIDDVLAISTRPVIVTHTGLAGHCPGPGNIADAQVKKIAAKGGLIGVGFGPAAVCGETAKDIAAAIRYAVDLAGVDHVGIGSGFDGAFIPPFDARGMPLLTQALLENGFSPEETGKIMGGNALALLLQTLPSENDAIVQGLTE